MAQYNFELVSQDPLLWVARPGTHAEFEWDGDPFGTLPPDARMTVQLNAEGLRGPLPAEGQPAVLLVGDSFTFGEGVPDDGTFARRLQRRLAPVDGAELAVVNAGVPGYGSLEESQRLPRWLDRFAPKAVVLVYVPNDPVHLNAALEQGDDLLNTGKPQASIRLLDLWRRVRAARATEDWYRSYYTGENKAEWARTKEHLGTMRDHLRERGIPFGVALFPLIHRLGDNPFGDLHGLVRQACADLGVPFTDLTPALAGVPERELWVHPTDHHPNAKAHELVTGPLLVFVDGLLGR